MIDLRVLRGIQEGHALPARSLAELVQLDAVPRKFLEIATTEFREAARVVRKPLAKPRTRREIALPGVECGTIARDASRPEPIHQHPEPVASFRRLVDALDAEVAGIRLLRLELGQQAGR